MRIIDADALYTNYINALWYDGDDRSLATDYLLDAPTVTAPERDTATWNQLAAEIRAPQAENDKLRGRAKPDKKLIYIAHPYGNKPENHALAITYMLRLTETYREYVFISPVISYGFAYDIYSYTDGIQQCLDLLSHAEELWIIGDDGWSKGVKIERAWSQHHGMTIKEFATLQDAVEGKEIV